MYIMTRKTECKIRESILHNYIWERIEYALVKLLIFCTTSDVSHAIRLHQLTMNRQAMMYERL